MTFPVLGSQWRWGGGVSEHMRRPLGNWQSDNAVDIMAPAGTMTVAPVAGKVVRISGSSPRLGPRGTVFGRSITIVDPAGREWFATHLDDPLVRVGQSVREGTPLARIADWGSNSHAHWAVNEGDPQTLFGGTSAKGAVSPAASASGLGCIVPLFIQLGTAAVFAVAVKEVFV